MYNYSEKIYYDSLWSPHFIDVSAVKDCAMTHS